MMAMTDDAELLRLLNEYGLALYQTGVRGVGDAGGTIIDARTALLAHVTSNYRRYRRADPAMRVRTYRSIREICDDEARLLAEGTEDASND